MTCVPCFEKCQIKPCIKKLATIKSADGVSDFPDELLVFKSGSLPSHNKNNYTNMLRVLYFMYSKKNFLKNILTTLKLVKFLISQGILWSLSTRWNVRRTVCQHLEIKSQRQKQRSLSPRSKGCGEKTLSNISDLRTKIRIRLLWAMTVSQNFPVSDDLTGIKHLGIMPFVYLVLQTPLISKVTWVRIFWPHLLM